LKLNHYPKQKWVENQVRDQFRSSGERSTGPALFASGRAISQLRLFRVAPIEEREVLAGVAYRFLTEEREVLEPVDPAMAETVAT